MKRNLFTLALLSLAFVGGAQVKDANGINDTTVDNSTQSEDADSK